MSIYPLHYLHDTEFEDLVVHICREILGTGVTSFAAGRDGGKDAKFDGKAEKFPSRTEPAEGKFIIQAKHTTNPVASCSDLDFKTKIIEKKECPKIKRMYDAKQVTHYLLFTNRRKTGGAEDVIPTLIQQKTGMQHVWLRGLEDIQRELAYLPEVVRISGLDTFHLPIQFFPDDIRDVIVAFHEHKSSVSDAFASQSQYDFRNYPGIAQKNTINGLSEEYFRECIEESSSKYFSVIRDFLKNPRNTDLADQYHAEVLPFR